MKQLSAHAPLPICQLNNHVMPAKCSPRQMQQHAVQRFQISSLGYAIALGSVTTVMPVTYANAAPIAPTATNQNSLSKNTTAPTVNTTNQSSSQSNSLPTKQITNKDQVNNAAANRQTNDATANNAANNMLADNDNNADNADNNKYDNNKAYQYPISSPQGIAHQIDKQLDNDKLADYNNFNQPAATLQRNKPTVGYNKALDNVAVPKLPPKISPPINSTSQNQPSNPDNPAISNNTAQQNNANESADIAKDTDINPDDYLPTYQQQPKNPNLPAAPKIIVANEKPNPLKRLYYRLINRTPGVDYIDIKIANADPKQQPAKNIKAALEEVTVESVADFNASIKRLRQIAQDAAEAVGYYDTAVSFKALGDDKVQVTINKVGKPVVVNSRVIDIRGEGGNGDNSLSVYQAIKEDIAPQKGEIFNQGTYKQTKATIENVARTNGFFDAKWLDNSVEVILPDNTADVSLIYDTKERYKFGDVKVYTLDKKGQLSDDPNKLPIKPKLLQQLINYKKGDPYYQPYITEFTNNLSATRYFNGIDVDVVLPPNEGNQATLGTGNSAGDNMAITGKVSDTIAATTNVNQAGAATLDNQVTGSQMATAMPGSGTTATNLTRLSNVASASDATSIAPKAKLVSNNSNDRPNKQTQNPADIAPLDFSADASTQERLKAIKNKAENLLDAPDDIELASGDNNPNRSPLAAVANAISKVARKIDRRDEDKVQLSQANQSDVIAKQTPEEVYQQKAVPTYVVLNATKPHEAQVGLGYETDVGERVVGKINNNLVNRNGLQAGVNVALSRVDQSLEVNGSYPYKHPLNDKITGSLGYQHRNIDDLVNTFETDSIYANIARNIYRETGWNRTYSMRYRSDKLSLNSGQYKVENLPAPFNNYASDFTQQALLFGYALSKTVADNLLSPTYGYSQRYSVELGGDGILADTNLAILRAGVTGLYSFGQDKKQQVLGRLDLGYIYSDDFLHVPYRLRFFAGGDQSIRGYNTDSQGPRYGKQDFLIGGDALAVGSLEYNYEFRPGLRAALFSDFGNAYDINDDYRNSTKVGLGAGIRWASPIGTVRLDVASGLSDSGEPIRLHFFIGSPL